MQSFKKIFHRRRSSQADDSVITLSVPKEQLKVLATDHVLAPQKSGILLKYTNVLKRWKRRFFILENGVLYYGAPSDDMSDEIDQPSNEPTKGSPPSPSERDKKKKKKSKRKRLLKRSSSKDEKERDIKGSINLQFAVISPDESDSCRFAIDVGNDVFFCKADTSQQRDEWVNALTVSNTYFRDLIRKAVARAKEGAAMEKTPSATIENVTETSVQHSPSSPSRAQQSNTDVTDDSDESFLEDDGLKEAEESRTTLIHELRRVLSIWRLDWVDNGSRIKNDNDLILTLLDTFRDIKQSPSPRNNPSAPPATQIANGLIDLVTWCLHVLQTNDDMFEKRLKADITRMMGREIPVFPKSPTALSLRDLDFDDENSDQEYVDALSRANSRRTSVVPSELFEVEAESLRMLKTLSIFEDGPETVPTEDQVIVKRVSARMKPQGSSVRTRLPVIHGTGEKLNVFGILKDAIGKDLSKISIPIGLNEPLSFLQRLAEDIEYCEILDIGAAEPDPHRRMMYVAAMVISHLSSTQGRIGKPFNPLLGETACLIRPNKGNGVRFISEQVSHHPPISACYAEGFGAAWKYYNNIEIKNKFWGKSIEVFPTGLNHVEFPEYGDHYVFEQITSCVHNIVIGRMWLDNYGEMEIVNRSNGIRCVIDFSKTGWMSDARSFASIKGKVYDKDGNTKIKIGGTWTESVYEELPGGKRNVIWKVDERPPDGASQSYNMTKWAISLNEEVQPQERGFIAPTDSRHRPDQRALEQGKYDLGSKLKHLLEEGQRKRRREMEAANKTWEPLWFEKVLDNVSGRPDYRFKGEFFKKQAEGDWSQCTDLFSCAGIITN